MTPAKRLLFILLGLIIVTLIVSGIAFTKHRKAPVVTTPLSTQSPSPTPSPSAANPQFVTANPLDVTQIKAISKFRSCAGHDFSGLDSEGIVESDRSMKHYIVPVDSLAGSVGKIKIFSPLTGVVDHFEPPHDGPGGKNGPLRGSGIWIKVSDFPLDVVLAHVDPTIEIKEGSELSAGQLVGYANLGNNPGNDFDLVIQGVNRQEKYESIFDHMTPDVLSQYASHGITSNTIIVTKDYRDQHPCGFPGKNAEGNGKLTNFGSDFVTLK